MVAKRDDLLTISAQNALFAKIIPQIKQYKIKSFEFGFVAIFVLLYFCACCFMKLA